MACYCTQKPQCGAGKFSYAIDTGNEQHGDKAFCTHAPNVVPEGERMCTPQDKTETNSCWSEDIHKDKLQSAINSFQDYMPTGPQKLENFKNISQVTKGSKIAYFLNIGVVPGCTMYKEQVVDNPQGKSGDDTISFQDIFRDLYDKCMLLVFFFLFRVLRMCGQAG